MRSVAAFAVGLATLTAGAQSANQDQPVHIQTALNHFTVVDPGEPIVMFALADHTSFDILQRENKIFLQPLSPKVATNLFIWTSSRELTYEVDPAGDLSKMNMLILSPPVTARGAEGNGVSVALKEEEVEQVSSQAWNEAVLGTEDVTDDQKTRPGTIVIRVEGVFRSKDRMIVRYSIRNLTTALFRVTTPDVFQSRPLQLPISLLSLRNHQLSEETFSQFKPLRGQRLPILHSDASSPELAAGQCTVGIVSIRAGQQNSPQLYQFLFGRAGDQDITAAVVM